MPTFAHQHKQSGEMSDTPTNGLILTGGWRSDLHGWILDTCVFRGQGRALRQRTVLLADLRPGEQVLDVGCGTGTLALAVQQAVGATGRVFGIDPSAQQIARARAKAARRNVPITFQMGVIEHLAFPDQMFDAVFSTLMMHHLPANLKRQGVAEIARVLTPGGRVVIADFTPKQERTGQAARFHAGGSSLDDLAALVTDVGFAQVDMEEMRPARFSAFPAVGIVRAYKSGDEGEMNAKRRIVQ